MTFMPKVDLSGKTCIVTGATTGIGREVARNLAGMRATVVLPARTLERGNAARDEIVASTGNDKVEVLLADLSSQASIRQFAKDFKAKHDRLHVLVNNAGLWANARELTPDGIEKCWATNVLAYDLLTRLLLDVLKASAPARIVNVASKMAWGLDDTDLPFDRRRWSGPAAYAQSKQANRMLTWALAKKLEGTGVTANAVHPGGVNTDITRHNTGVIGALAAAYFKLFGRTPAQGADTPTWVAVAPELAGVTGRFYSDRRESRCAFRDEAAIARLVAIVEQQAPG